MQTVLDPCSMTSAFANQAAISAALRWHHHRAVHVSLYCHRMTSFRASVRPRRRFVVAMYRVRLLVGSLSSGYSAWTGLRTGKPSWYRPYNQPLMSTRQWCHHFTTSGRTVISHTIKTRIYQALVQSVILHASETWTLLSVDSTALEAFHMKCQRQLLQIKCRHQFIRNVEISAITGLPSISETISGRRNSLFGHVAKLADDVSAHKALSSQINLSL